MIKPKLSLAAILSTTAIASGIVFSQFRCSLSLREYRTSPEQSSQVNGYALLGSCFDIAWNSPGRRPLRRGRSYQG